VSWDIIARALFVDSGLAKGVAETNAKIHDLAKAAPGGARGLNLVETSMRSLAFEAVGIQGPLGRIAEGLLKFGGGSTLVLGVTAGIGLIAAVYKDFTAEARAAEKAQTDFIESLKKTPQGAALVGRNALKEAQDKLRSLTAPGATGPGGAMIPPAMIEQARMEVAQLQNALVPLQNAAAETAKRRTEEIDRQNEALAAQALAMRDLVAVSAELAQAQGYFLGITPGLVAQIPRYQRSQDIAADVGAASTAQLANQISMRLIGVSMGRRYTAETPGQAAKSGGVDGARLAAESVALLGALHGGSAGGSISALGGILGSISAIPGPVGPILTGLGGVFSLFDHSAERRHREEMDKLTRIIQNTDKRGQPDHTSVTIMLNGKEVSGALVDDVIYQINRMSRRDATPRLPSS
jgi:hypothetical protein